MPAPPDGIVMVTPFSFRQLMYAANAELPPPCSLLVPLVLLLSSEPPPQAAVNSTATEATSRAPARRRVFELTTGTLSLLSMQAKNVGGSPDQRKAAGAVRNVGRP